MIGSQQPPATGNGGLACVLAAIPETLPASVADKARLALGDFLASAFESADRPWCRQALDLAVDGTAYPGAGTSSVIGHNAKVALADAVLVNAVLGHGLVRDDMHLGAISHLGIAVMPVALGLAELAPTDGRRLLAAIVAGYEAGGRIGRLALDAETARIHRPTGITGPFAAAAAAARLLDLDAAQTANALALACNTTAGLNAWAATGGDEMFFQAGLAARSGLTAAQLAARGARPSADALDGPAGLLASLGKTGPARFDDAAELEISSVFFKEVPACNYAQSPAQAARRLAERHAPALEEIEHVRVHVSRAAVDYPGCDSPGPLARELQAKMSIQYNVAAALATARFDEASYDPLRNAEIGSLARAIELVVDDALSRAYPGRQGAEVRVRLRGGRELAERLDDVEPASPSLVERRLERAARAALGEPAAGKLLAAIARLGSEAPVGELLSLTAPPEPAPSKGASAR